MVHLLKRPLFRTLIYLLVAGQIFLSVPVVAAVSTAENLSSEMPCAGSMPQAEDPKPCPCCPDDEMGTAACLSACSGAVATSSTIIVPFFLAIFLPASATQQVHRTLSADPPLKPPPIY